MVPVLMVRVCRNVAVASVMPFGCIVDFAPGKSGLVHVSELDVGRTTDPTAVWKAGDKIDVKILEYDKASGRCKLSRYSGSRLIDAHPRVMNSGPGLGNFHPRLKILRPRVMDSGPRLITPSPRAMNSNPGLKTPHPRVVNPGPRVITLCPGVVKPDPRLKIPCLRVMDSGPRLIVPCPLGSYTLSTDCFVGQLFQSAIRQQGSFSSSLLSECMVCCDSVQIPETPSLA